MRQTSVCPTLTACSESEKEKEDRDSRQGVVEVEGMQGVKSRQDFHKGKETDPLEVQLGFQRLSKEMRGRSYHLIITTHTRLAQVGSLYLTHYYQPRPFSFLGPRRQSLRATGAIIAFPF